MNLQQNQNVSKVFVTQYSPRLDFSKLNEYGEVIFLTKNEFRPDPTPPIINQTTAHEIARNMFSYIPGIDFIVTTGSALPNVYVGSILEKGLIHHFLKWDARQGEYKLFKIRIN